MCVCVFVFLFVCVCVCVSLSVARALSLSHTRAREEMKATGVHVLLGVHVLCVRMVCTYDVRTMVFAIYLCGGLSFFLFGAETDDPAYVFEIFTGVC